MKTPRELAALFSELGHDERKLAELILERLRMGREAYGEWLASRDGRDLHREALEESADVAIYLAMAVLRLGSERPGCAESDFGGEGPEPSPEGSKTPQIDARQNGKP